MSFQTKSQTNPFQKRATTWLSPVQTKSPTNPELTSTWADTRQRYGAPVSSTAQKQWWQSPAALAMMGTAAKQIIRGISPDRQMQIYEKVLQSQIDYRNTLLQRAYGHFTPADVQDIQRSAEPAVNAIAQGVAARGLGTSPAGAQIIAEAQQRPFTQAQQQAQAQLPQWDMMIMQNAQALMGDPSFFSDIDSIVQLLIEEFDEDPETKENDPEYRKQVESVFNWLKSIGAI